MNETYIAPLPKSVRDRIDGNTHPGLFLDKFVPSWSDALPPEKLSAAVQRPAIDQIVALTQAPPPGLPFDGLIGQRKFTLDAIYALRINATTTGPLTLHLSRASSLENAGICLHRIYGFVYLPGTGVKGMARAFAETVWLPTQSNEAAAWQEIEEVFGWAPNRDRDNLTRQNPSRVRYREFEPKPEQGKRTEQKEHAGRVVFHDAWPLVWPALQTDILNSHHHEYYAAKERVPSPGDWEEPIPVYFLAVKPGIQFEFAVSARRETDLVLAERAREWIAGALEHAGTGAKTNAGYGGFRIDEPTADFHSASAATWQAAESKGTRWSRSITLTLATPAFLAGADAEDPATCDLRVPTLRGQLRSWWRTLHAAHLNPADLRRLESAIWGNTSRGGAIRVSLTRVDASPPKLFDRRGIIDANKLPEPPNKKTTQGLTYASYGMDEIKDRSPVRRPYLEPGATWKVTLTIRPGKYVIQEQDRDHKEVSQALSVDQLATEALAAMELLCRLGGVGSKSRKGFGCFQLPADFPAGSLEERQQTWIQQSANLRSELGLRPGKSESSALEHLLVVDPVPTPWSNYWMALDRLSDSAQAFSQSKKHQLDKKALGLPRNVRAPHSGSFTPGKDVRDRHSSPIHYHLSIGTDGHYIAQIVAFPADRLPTLAVSRTFLTAAIQQIRQNLVERVDRFAQSGTNAAVGSRNTVVTRPAPAGPKLPVPGMRVTATLSTEKTSKKGWKATHANMTGPIQNSPDVPADQVPGNEVTLIVRICTPKEIAFRWPTAADEKRPPRK